MFCKNLKRLRKQKKLTQSDVAKMLNISRVAYTNYELGNREPDFETIKNISEIFSTSIDILLDNTSFTAELDKSLETIADLPKNLQNILRGAAQLNEENCIKALAYINFLIESELSQNP